MLTIGGATPEAREVMANALRGKPGFDHEYPMIFGKGARGRVVSLSEDDAVRSACAMLVRDMRCPEARLRLGLIGSVATEAAARGRGHAGRVLAHAEAELAERGCLASLLWADDESFYEAHGYQRVGAEEDFLLERALRPHLGPTDAVRPACANDAAAIHQLYRGHSRRTIRSSAETRALLDGPGMRVFVHEGSDGITAYTCLGRGGDLASVIHEWAGETDGLLACLAATLDAVPGTEPLFLMAPLELPGEDEGGLPHCLREVGVPSAPGVLAMGRLLRADIAERHLREACTMPRALEFTRAGDGWSLGGPNGTVQAGAGELLGWLLAPRAERGAIRLLEHGTGLGFPGLPMRPFLWGLDSI